MTVPKSISDGPLMSTSDVAKRLKVHRSTVWLWIRRGMLKSEQHGAFHGVRRSALDRFLSFYELEPKKKKRRKAKKKRTAKAKKKRSKTKTKKKARKR